MASIANSIPAGRGDLIVFNALNWKRSGPVTVDLDKKVEICDAAGNMVPMEILINGPNYQHIRFEAQDVPAVGYKVFQVKQATKDSDTAETKATTTLEGRYYKVELDPATGAVRSIYDKQLQRELVEQHSPYRFGQYLYVSGGDKAPNSILQYGGGYPKADLNIHGAQGGTLVAVKETPDGWVAQLQSHAANTPTIATEMRLSNREKRIEFVEDLDKTATINREAAYFAFPFAMEHPQFHYEIQNGVVDPATDMYPGAGHEWFSVQHWVSVQQDGLSATVMPLDASLVTLGDINRGEWPEQFGNRTGTVFSYIMNNYWDTNYRAAQGGHFQFHYVVTSAPVTDAGSLSRMGWEAITPLEVDTVTSQDKAAPPPPKSTSLDRPASSADAGAVRMPRLLDAGSQSFLDVADPNLLLETWKAAEDGNGTILRFLDLGGAERKVKVQLPLIALKQATQTDAVERSLHPLAMEGLHSFTFTIHHDEVVTVRVTEFTPMVQ
jgi:alpha-mannosidase